MQVDIITAQGQYTEKDAAAAIRTMLEVGCHYLLCSSRL
jgi:hypothetical protein